MAWHPYDLDHLAQEIVLKARNSDQDSLNQAYKMRATCAYGLERFWGEHLRLADKEPTKAQFVADVWSAFVGIMKKSGIKLPGEMRNSRDPEADIQSVAEQLWRLSLQDQQASLAVLTALCDAVVWWTQRLKTGKGGGG
ncbi:MAG: hypothetical protein VKJ44_05085 [Synechococcus sp.]|nr:hypothetical protein [Synechococcus sp.]